jgi:hypothetical protein
MGAVALANAHAAPAPVGAETGDPQALARLYRQMRFAPPGAPFYWWLQGRRYGLIDNVLTPFFDMHVGSVHLCIDDGGGRYRILGAQSAYYTDLQSGALLREWRNPITGAMVPLNYAAPRANATAYDDKGLVEGAAAPGIERHHFLGPASRVGDALWLREESHVVIAPAAAVAASGGGVAGTQPLRVHDMYTLQSPLAALRVRGTLPRWVPANGQFNDFNSWSPRFQMGDRPGTSLSRCAGRKERTWSAMPARYRELAAEVHPEWARDPAAVLD